MRAARALALGMLISVLSLGPIGGVSAHRLAGGPCGRPTCAPSPAVVYSAPVVDGRSGRVFVARQSMTGGRPRGQGAVLMLDGRRGILLRRVAVDALPVVDDIVSGPLLVDSAGGRVVVTTGACAPASVLPCVPTRESLSVLDAQTGAVLWSRPLGMTPRVAHSSEAFLPLTAMASGPQGRYVALIGGTGVRVLDLSTRTLSAWTPLPGSACGRPTATDDQAGHIILVRSGWNVNAGQLART